MITTSMGKQLRLRRLFRDGKVLTLPMDHPIYFGPQPGLEDPTGLVKLAREHGATSILATAGALRAVVEEIGDMAVIMRIDATISHIGGPDDVMHMLHSAEEACALGADMVIVNCFLGMGNVEVESALLKKLAAVSAECERIGMPLCPELIPRNVAAGHPSSPPSSADMALALRMGLEYGCDMVKTIYNGDPEGFAQAVKVGGLPVIMAGGPKSGDELAIFQQLHEAMTHGACGAVIGRRVWGSQSPGRSLDAVRAIVFEGASPADARRICQG